MGQPKLANKVKLFVAITFNNQTNYQKVKHILKQQFNQIDLESEIYDFNFTDYYEKEMGTNLKKQFISFQQLIKPENLIEIKLWTNEVEKQFIINDKRQVNIDPGYLTSAKVVLATTKNYSHRIYLGKGIYGDVHLRFVNRRFQTCEWTYADYKQTLAIEFFSCVKKIYMKSHFE